MSTTLPELTRTIDNAFVTTWYEIRQEAMDNILNATATWAALYGAGCMTPQVGGELITRTIRYGEAKTPQNVKKGDVLPQGESELETMARWEWKYTAGHVQRSAFDDQKNSGPSKIKDLVGMRLGAARDALEQKFEADIWGSFDSSESGKTPLGLNDLVPLRTNRTSGTFGAINRPTAYADQGNGVEVPSTGNTWWGPKYMEWTANKETNMESDMRTFYNSLHNNQQPPNLIISDQDDFETYEEVAVGKEQIIRDEATRLANLGFEVLRFKGKPMIWVPDIDAGNMLMLNTEYIEIVYDPKMYFAMTAWKPIGLQAERIAHILCAHTMISDQLRRHGRISDAA